MDILKVDNLSYSYGDKKVIDDVSFSIKEKSINAVLSSNNSCKTTLIKILSGVYHNNSGKIYVNDILLNKNNFKKYIINISTILDDLDDQFVCKTVKEEIEYPLINLKYKSTEIEDITNKVIELLKIKNILNIKTNYLTNYERVKVLLAASIVHKPKLLFIDDVLRFLNNNERKEIIKLFNDISKEFEIAILFTTSNLIDVKNLDNIIVLNEGKIVMNDSFDNIILKDNELSKIGIDIPLMIDLSRKCQFYILIDKIYYDRDKVVDALWK